MAHVLRPGLVLGLALWSWSSWAAAGDEPLPPARRWVPESAVLVVEVSHPRAVLDLALGQKVTDLLTSQPAYKVWAESTGFRTFVQVVRALEVQLGTDWKPGLNKLLEGGVTSAVLPGGASLLIVDSGDEALLGRLNQVLVQGTRDDAAKHGRADRVTSHEVRGVTVWTLDGKEAHAILGKRLILASTASALEAVLDCREHPDSPSLEKSGRYRAALQAAGSQAAATAYADLNALKQDPKVADALSANVNPLGVLLFAGVTETLRHSSWLSASLRIDGESLSLLALADGKPGAASAFMYPAGGAGALPSLVVPRQIAGLSVYRDLHAFYAAKDQLFPERTSGLIFFENMMGIFFSGRDLTEDVFAETCPDVRFVMAAQAYEKAVGTPLVQIPAFAMVVRTRHSDEFARVAEEAWQKAVGLTTVTRGQQAEPGLIIDRETYQGIRFSIATNAAGKHDDKAHLPSRFNYSPSLARVGDCFVLASTGGLTRDLIDALLKASKAPAQPLTGTHTLASIDGLQLAALVKANRETLVTQNMVEKGHARLQAEHHVDALEAIARLVGRATLTGGVRDGQARIELGITLNLP